MSRFKENENFGDWTYTQTFIIYQIWLHNRGWIGDVAQDIHLLLADKKVKEMYHKWLDKVWVREKYLTRCLFVYNELRLLKHISVISRLHEPMPGYLTRSELRVIPDYIEVLSYDSVSGEVTKYRNVKTKIVRDVGSSKNLLVLAGRRFGKTFFTLNLFYGLLQLPFLNSSHILNLILPSEAKATEFSGFIGPFFDTKSRLSGLGEIKFKKSENKYKKDDESAIFSMLTIAQEAVGRGVTSLGNAIDEAGFITDIGLKKVQDALKPNTLESLGFNMITTSPSENDINTAIRDSAYDYNTTFSVFLPTYANVSRKAVARDFNLAVSSTAADIRSYIEKKDRTSSATFFGYPLNHFDKSVYRSKHFTIYNTEELGADLTEGKRYLSIEQDLTSAYLTDEEKIELKRRYDDDLFGGRPENITFSVITADTGFSGKGDDTVFVHLGYSSTSKNFYILDIFKEKISWENILGSALPKYIIERVLSPYGEKLKYVYIEDLRGLGTIAIKTVQDVTRNLVDIEVRYREKESGERIKRIMSDISMGTISPAGKTSSREGVKEDFMRTNDHGRNALELDFLNFPGNKGERAMKAVTILSRWASSGKSSRVIFFPYLNNNPRINAVILECYKEAINFINLGKSVADTQKDDFVDALTYAIFVYDNFTTYDAKLALYNKNNGHYGNTYGESRNNNNSYNKPIVTRPIVTRPIVTISK
jgi:hypothetical protein